MGKVLKVILIGAGSRGRAYTNAMGDNPDKYQVIAVADPIKSRRDAIQERHNIPDEMCFDDWRPLLELGKIADVAVIATMDRDHIESGMKAISLKYDLLLEKPFGVDYNECVRIADYAEEMNVNVVICTVLRYTSFFMKLKEIIDSGQLGRIISINHEECVGNVHQSHSFVRGNWGNSNRSSCMLLQKSCHDIDILQWLIGKQCKKVQSFGALSYFKEENAPADSPEYCVEGCPVGDACPYNAVKLYYDDKTNDWFRNACTRSINATDEMVMKAITTTQYGKCVFKCDNDVVDHQTVNLLFEDDITVTFTMCAFNRGRRCIHIMGTKGEVNAALDGDVPITLYDFETKETTTIDMSGVDGVVGGHGGGDAGIVEALYEYLTGTYQGNAVPTIRESCNNHMIVFAAEESRKNHTVVDFEDFISRKLQ